MNSPEIWGNLEDFLAGLVADGTAPGAVALVCGRNGPVFSWAGGNRETVPRLLPMKMDTFFDLASLTKVVAVTMAAARLEEQGKLSFAGTLGDFFADPGVFGETTVAQILTHTGGFIAEQRLWDFTSTPDDVISFILKGPREYEPGTKVVYSCFGFIILGEIIRRVCGISLDKAVAELVTGPLGMNETCYRPGDFLPDPPGGFASTEFDKRSGAMISGIVHDENARFLHGVSGNAGIFSNSGDLEKWLLMLINRGIGPGGDRFLSEETVTSFHTNLTPGMEEERGIGFKLYGRPGVNDPAAEKTYAYGHTGFTGTSVLIDPVRQAGLLLLTNRVHPTREEQRLLEKRAVFNEIAFTCFDRLG
ncbi:serine hydrolase domain-containing protein [Breznakiella homolactica]|uniref:Beta-lactamase family protein n=1 Tax=Breznakiella homolactica TaxID=2798577 RepID=A0A7T7XJD9_9SPIR|nr:serine hydrolase domain-containing protein [Breznakiella homolactica]QQO07509.1 beta-lactamase family protein [Breznakiella homolactica]